MSSNLILVCLDPKATNSEHKSVLVKDSEDGAGSSNDTDKSDKQKRKRGKRSGKNRIKQSPTDSPLKTVHVSGEPSRDNFQSAKKEEHHLTVAQNISQAVKSASSAKHSVGLAMEGKEPNNSQTSSEVSSSGEEPILGTFGAAQPVLLKPKDVPTKPSQREQFLQYCKMKVGTSMPSDRPGDVPYQRENGDMYNPFEKQPMLLLRAAVNLIKPKRKIGSHKVRSCIKQWLRS